MRSIYRGIEAIVSVLPTLIMLIRKELVHRSNRNGGIMSANVKFPFLRHKIFHRHIVVTLLLV